MGMMGTGRFVDLICKKREGIPLQKEEIRTMIKNYTEGRIPDYQMSAMLMAIYFRGMNDDELTELTLAMRDSGDVLDLSAIPGIKVDKHSTGGVGDKTTLIIGPIVAACGVPVAKMSGRGLGFTGGTLDKLESIPGFRTNLSGEEFFSCVQKNGVSVIGQTADLAPADKLLYALRDVTGTIESIPLIAASVMSKKLAAGSDKILLDVTTGSGAFIKELERSRELAGRMAAIGNSAGKETVAIITSMDEPLGYAVGNALEVREVIAMLQGEGPEDLREVCLTLAGMMISMGRTDASFEEGYAMAEEALASGAAYKKFREMVSSQGGKLSCIDSPGILPQAEVCYELAAPSEGYLYAIDTEGIGIAAGLLGAGRETKESTIDAGAGLIMRKKTGAYVKKGEILATLYTADEEHLLRAREHLASCFTIREEPPEPKKLIVDIIR